MNINRRIAILQALLKKLSHRNFEQLSFKESSHLATLVHQEPEVMHQTIQERRDLTEAWIIFNEYSYPGVVQGA